MKVITIALFTVALSCTPTLAANSLEAEFSAHEKLGSFSMKQPRVGMAAKSLIDEATKSGFFCREESSGTTCEKEVKDLGMCGIIWNLEIYTNISGDIRSTRQAIVQRCI